VSGSAGGVEFVSGRGEQASQHAEGRVCRALLDLVTLLTDRNATGAEAPVTSIDRSHQL
jgi:hypothetical protein